MKKIFCSFVCFTLLNSCSLQSSENMWDSEITRTFFHHFMEHYTTNWGEGLFGSTIWGIHILQNPADMWIMQEIIAEIIPDFIIETGTFMGGSAVYFATFLKHVNDQGRVISIDIDPKLRVEEFERLKNANQHLYKIAKGISDTYVEYIASNSVDPALIASLKERTKGKKVIVILDSCHSYEHVLKELILYSDLVSPGSYLIVQDTYIDDKKEWIEKHATCPGYTIKAGPMRAVKEFLKQNRNFTVDRSKERYLFTFHPSGYLKKNKI